MPTISFDCTPLLNSLASFSRTCGTREAAAKRLGIAKSTLTKWFAKRTISADSLLSLAAFEGDAELAKTAQKLLADSNIAIETFPFGHIASQLMCVGPGECMLFRMLERSASVEELEFGAAHDLATGFAEMQYYNALSEVAQEGFQELPHPPLPQLGRSDYEELIFPDEDETDEPSAPAQIDWSKIDWEKIKEPYTLRSNAARSLLACARDEPPHCLFDKIVDTLYCRVRKREADGITLTKEECIKVAALAAADCYKLESGVMEAADTIRRAASAHRTLASSPLYALATKIFEICYLNRSIFTINRLTALTNMLGEDKVTIGKIEGICEFVRHALYSATGAYFFQPGFASAKVNAHGSVIDYDRGPTIRGLVGKKRKAPKQAIVRGKSMPRPSRRGFRAGRQG